MDLEKMGVKFLARDKNGKMHTLLPDSVATFTLCDMNANVITFNVMVCACGSPFLVSPDLWYCELERTNSVEQAQEMVTGAMADYLKERGGMDVKPSQIHELYGE